MGKSLKERFDEKVDRSGDCWEWTAAKNNHGYGMIRPGGLAEKQLSHRISWIFSYGEIPDGLCVLHKCDNPGCVNPGHLFLGTHKDNMQDKELKGRGNHVMGELSSGKLSELGVRVILRAVCSGLHYKKIAEVFGVHDRTVRSIRDGETWSHVKHGVCSHR